MGGQTVKQASRLFMTQLSCRPRAKGKSGTSRRAATGVPTFIGLVAMSCRISMTTGSSPAFRSFCSDSWMEPAVVQSMS